VRLVNDLATVGRFKQHRSKTSFIDRGIETPALAAMRNTMKEPYSRAANFPI
jgi:hypothetical protein